MPVVIEQRVELAGSPGVVFAFLTDPDRRPEWDAACLRCELEGERAAAGVRVRLTGRGMAPSWLGEYSDFRPARSASIRLIEGQGMPFRSYSETTRVEVRKGGGCTVTLRYEYEMPGLARMIEPLTVRSKLRRVARRSAGNLKKRLG